MILEEDYYDDRGRIAWTDGVAEIRHVNAPNFGRNSHAGGQPRRGGRFNRSPNQNVNSQFGYAASNSAGAVNTRRGRPQRSNNQNGGNIGSTSHERRNNTSNQARGNGPFFNESNNGRAPVYGGNQSQPRAPRHNNGQNNPVGNDTRHGRTDMPQREWKPGFGFKKLLEISEMDPTTMLLHFNNETRNFNAMLNDDLKPDIIILAMKCLSAVCSTAFDESKLSILMDVCNSNFITTLEKYITNLPYETHQSRLRNKLLWENLSGFWINVFQLCNGIIDLLPSKAVDCLVKFVDMMVFTIQRLADQISPEIHDKLNRCKEKMFVCQEKVNLKREEVEQARTLSKKADAPPPDDFREIEIMPTIEELTVRQNPYLRANIIDGAYENVDHYLDIQFRLMREDFINPLRKGIVSYLEDPAAKRFENIRVYKKVRLDGLTILRGGGMGMVVTFDESLRSENARKKQLERKRNLANTKRFMFGSLLCFTKDNFQTMFFATVNDRDNLAQGQVTVALEEFFESAESSDISYLMVESEVYFLPYFYVLKALQRPNLADVFPMERYIVSVQPIVNHPNYINRDTRYTICNGSDVSVLHDFTWPSADKVGLDETQYEAYKMALTREFVTIQGPPGTGKTYVGLKVAKSLIENSAAGNTPILVVCFTNHALDQFLEGLLDTTQKIVRIGGQSKNEALKEYNLQALRKQKKRQRFKGDFFRLSENIGKIRQRINLIESRSGILNLAEFIELIHVNIVKFLKPFDTGNGRTSLVNWLMMSDMVVDEWNPAAKLDRSQYNKNEEESDDDLVSDSDSEDDRRRRLDIDDDEFQVPNVSNVDFFCIQTLWDEIQQIKDRLNSNTVEGREDATMRLAILQNEMAFLKMQLNKPRTEDYVFYNTDVDNPSSFDIAQRWTLYWQWIDPVLVSLNADFVNKMDNYKQSKNNYDELILAADKEILAEATVIGITTTGAARLQSLLRSLGSRIVIVEEAAEVMESHIVVSLSSACQHLIMIGDHQQLRPTAATYHLTRHFNLDISLFERMVKNGNHCYQLGVQHRMRPEIAALISPTIYPHLKNHPSVNDFPTVKGVHKSLAFIRHEYPEKKEESISSRLNTHEAEFLLCLAKYLIQQGYSPDDITILAAYSGQMFHLKQERRKYAFLSHVRITVLDSYQGEESKIILLSLVRSNAENVIGFLSIENRVCVALSRAKEGFYIIGNMANMMHKTDLWKEINKSLEKQNAIGDSLTLKCEIHRDTFTEVKEAKDFDRVPEGGCSQICDTLLKCGHNCLSVCHPQDREHDDHLCTANCDREVCIYGHACPDPCYKECRPCNVLMTRDLPCSHKALLKCHLDPKKHNCKTIVKVVLKLCEHEAEKLCYVSDDDVRCPMKCIDRLSCGHACTQLCHKKVDPDHVYFSCNEPCPRFNKGCVKDHPCNKLCYENCNPCSIKIFKKRDGCAHKEKVECHSDVNATPCKNRCTRSMPCGHFCKKLCFEECTDCRVKVNKVRSCGHQVMVSCNVDVELVKCAEKCERKLKCGHTCRGLCSNPCDVRECRVHVPNPYISVCGHQFTVPCNLSNLDKAAGREAVMWCCKEPCKAMLKGCEHTCNGTCGQCHGGVLHLPCKEPCGHLLVCGHSCNDPCREACPPCKKPCQVKCGHSICRLPCGVPCPPCAEKCKRGCMHRKCSKKCGDICDLKDCTEACPLRLKCGHPCRGLCGEVCPPICHICRPDDFPTIFFGNEEDEDARFVKLVDCPHSVEVTALDTWVENESDESRKQIGIRPCPYCKTPIVNTLRYSDYVKRAYRDIEKAKGKVFGDSKTTVAKLQDSVARMNHLLAKPHNMKRGNGDDWIKLCTKLSKEVTTNIPKMQTSRPIICRLSNLDADRIKTQVDILKKISKLYLLSENFKCPALDAQMSILIKAVAECGTKIAQQQSEDFSHELLRLERRIHLLTIEATPQYRMSHFKTQVVLSSNHIRAFITSLKPFTESVNLAVGNELKKLKSLLDVQILTDTERQMIVGAMGLRQGHWFKCPNGHPYCIADCGGAMVEAVCPECKATIGGTNHRLLSSNRVATEMDGARHAAWSDTANMANYGLD